jgi:hypothetical protein
MGLSKISNQPYITQIHQNPLHAIKKIICWRHQALQSECYGKKSRNFMSVLLPGIDEGIDVWKQEDSTDEQVRTTLLTPDTTCESNSCTNTE